MDDHGFEGPLAEFTALREEIQERVKAQQQLMSLQLTGSAAVFGFAVTQDGMKALLLIVPFTSYLLCGRLVAQHFAIFRVAEYIQHHLSPRVPGGLLWERWLRERPTGQHLLGAVLPLLLSFVGAGVLALVWAFEFVFAQEGLALKVLWFLGLGGEGLSAMLVMQMAGWLSDRGWQRAGIS